MITKKRVELYMQRRARLQDTHEDAESFEDFDMDDCDFRLDGNEGNFTFEGTKEDAKKAYAAGGKDVHETNLPPEDMIIPELPDLGDTTVLYSKVVGTKKEPTLNHEWVDKTVLERMGDHSPEKQQLSDSSVLNKPVVPPPPVRTTPEFFRKDLISTDTISVKMLKQITKLALSFKEMRQSDEPIPQYLENKVVTLLFEEPSTRTRCSFESAIYRLGGKVVKVDDMSSSSRTKGETFEDTVKVLSSYSDALVVRSKETGGAKRACNVNGSCPIISAGDGKGEHPTQALLDFVTMVEACPDLTDERRARPITIGFVGDLKNGRTVHSLVKLLNKIPNVKMIFIAPPTFQIYACPEFGDCMSSGFNMSFKKTFDLEVGQCDFLYVTRLQKERLTGEKTDDYPPNLNMAALRDMEAVSHMMIMHPLPRVDEIDSDIDDSNHQLYFKQAENGLYTRMALLTLVLSQKQ